MFAPVIGGMRSDGTDEGNRRPAGPRIWRRPMPAGRLGWASAANGRPAVSLADDVREADVAGAARHLLTEHAGTDGIDGCALPICAAALSWRPSHGAAGIASSA